MMAYLNRILPLLVLLTFQTFVIAGNLNPLSLAELRAEGGTVIPLPVLKPPNASLRGLVAPIRTKLVADPTKAGKVAWAFTGFAKAMRGPSAKNIKDVQKFGQINVAALQSLGMGEGTTIGKEITQIMRTYANISTVNRSFTDIDREKIAEIFEAVAWAAAN